MAKRLVWFDSVQRTEDSPAIRPEIVSHIHSFSDLSSLLSFNHLIRLHSEQVFQNILASRGYCNPRFTSPPGDLLFRRKLTLDGQKKSEGDDNELQNAVVNQRSGTDYFEGVKTFEELGKPRRLALLDRRWLCNDFKIRAIPVHRVWHVKVDTERKLLLTSATDGIIAVRDLDTEKVLWQLRVPAERPQIEYSGGYLIHKLNDDYFYVWRHDSIDPPRPSPVDCTGFPTPSTSTLTPHARLRQPARSVRFAAKHPYLACGTFQGHQPLIFVWDFVKNELTRVVIAYSGALSEDVFYEMLNLEVDRDFIFLATETCVEIFRTSDGSLISTIPPSAIDLPNRHPEEHEEEEDTIPRTFLGPFIAVRHFGPHLLALSRSGLLYWTCRFPRSMSGPQSPRTDEDWVVLNFGLDAHQLIVENGRAVIVLFRGPTEEIYLINLIEWKDHEHFRSSAPKLETLSSFHPSIATGGISGIDMDSTSIYVASRELHPLKIYEGLLEMDTPEYWEFQWEKYKKSRKWTTLDGQVLADAMPDTLAQTKDDILKKGGLDKALRSVKGHRDRVLVFNFF